MSEFSCLICKENIKSPIVFKNCACKSVYCLTCAKQWYVKSETCLKCVYCQKLLCFEDMCEKNIFNLQDIFFWVKNENIKVFTVPNNFILEDKTYNIVDISIIFNKFDLVDKFLSNYNYACSTKGSYYASNYLPIYKLLFFADQCNLEYDKYMAIIQNNIKLIKFLLQMAVKFDEKDLIQAYLYKKIDIFKLLYNFNISLNDETYNLLIDEEKMKLDLTLYKLHNKNN